MVRDGAAEDLPQVVAMSAEFWKQTRYDEPFDPEHVWHMAALALEHGLMAILEIDGEIAGFVAGLKSPLLGNASVMNGSEIAWWVNPDARKGHNGIALMQYIEQMARNQGVKYWNMMVMESCQPEVGAAIYERLGYEKSETTYTRVL